MTPSEIDRIMALADSYANHRAVDGAHDLVDDHPDTLKARAALLSALADYPGLSKTDNCDTCAHYKRGVNPLVGIYDEVCFGCSQYYSNRWEGR